MPLAITPTPKKGHGSSQKISSINTVLAKILVPNVDTIHFNTKYEAHPNDQHPERGVASVHTKNSNIRLWR